MFKRMFLMFGVNMAFVLVISLVMSILGVGNYITSTGLDLKALAVLCALWGFMGAFFSLAISKWSAKRMYKLELIDNKGAYGNLVEMIYRSARKSGITTMPEVGIYHSPEMNAFATGRSKNNSLVAVSTGLLQGMNEEEVEGVLAHEIAHIANGDMITMALIQGVINAFVMFFARIVAFVISQAVRGDDEEGEGLGFFAHIAVVMLFEMIFGLVGSSIAAWFSRSREYRADAGSARLVGREKMIAALEKLKAQYPSLSTRGNSMSAMQISSRSKMSMIFSSHPSIDSRIAALKR